MAVALFSRRLTFIQDPWRQLTSANISHPVFDVRFLTICAVTAGDPGWAVTEGEPRLEWRQKYGLFKHESSAHGTVAWSPARECCG